MNNVNVTELMNDIADILELQETKMENKVIELVNIIIKLQQRIELLESKLK